VLCFVDHCLSFCPFSFDYSLYCLSFVGSYDGNSVTSMRFPNDSQSHQVVLKTPYGTFYKEENAGFYGLVSDQPFRIVTAHGTCVVSLSLRKI
jgi:hypothetical protein